MATERKQIGGAKVNEGTQPVLLSKDLATVVGAKTPVPITGSGNVALHGLIADLTVKGTGFTAGEST